MFIVQNFPFGANIWQVFYLFWAPFRPSVLYEYNIIDKSKKDNEITTTTTELLNNFMYNKYVCCLSVPHCINHTSYFHQDKNLSHECKTQKWQIFLIMLNISICRAVSATNKRQTIFKWLENSHNGITLLHETHSSLSDEIKWTKEWR